MNNVFGQILLVGLAAAAVFSCGSGDDSGSGGSSGAAGSGAGAGGKGGAAGSAAIAGNSNAGSAGSSGGTQPTGGSSGSAGSGGTGGSMSSAGGPGSDNGGAAGEGPIASVACNECVANAATTTGDTNCQVDCVKPQLSTDTDVTTCLGILGCVRQSMCFAAGMADGTACYCGGVASSTCFSGLVADPNNPPAGVCASEIATALPAGSPPVAVGLAYYDTSGPIGVALARSACEQSFCAKECGLATGAAGAGSE
ncbi:MAG TPA: hypothetical protein VGF76_01740 [Polyangiaceae bacterium]|nr:hypothetical protein [Polyangiaceae bacterium]